jgi:CRP/FNR family transcriptional regulator, cyclic AMP receptor protein
MLPFRCEPPEHNFFLKSLIQSGTSHLHVRKKGVIFSQGDASDAFLYVEKGTIKLTVLSEHGKEAVIRLCREGTFFGYNCLANPPARRHCSAVAIADADLHIMTRESVLRSMRSNDQVMDCLVSLLLDRIVGLESELASCLIDSKEERLARVLLSLARSSHEAKPELIPGINQQTLAEMIGSTRQRVNIFLQKFRKMGLIEEGQSRNYQQSSGQETASAKLPVARVRPLKRAPPQSAG